jgi:hypothetical protein
MGRLCAVVLAVLLLAACSSGTASQPPSAASVARQLGATGVEAITPPTLYAYDECTATLHGKTVDIATFRTNALRDKWVQAASQFTGIESKGDRYAVADG